MMVDMISDDDLVLDCRTCVAANTTACSDCVVLHLLANDSGPIDFVPSPVRSATDSEAERQTERAVELFAKAGLLDDEPQFISYAEFESAAVPLPR